MHLQTESKQVGISRLSDNFLNNLSTTIVNKKTVKSGALKRMEKIMLPLRTDENLFKTIPTIDDETEAELHNAELACVKYLVEVADNSALNRKNPSLMQIKFDKEDIEYVMEQLHITHKDNERLQEILYEARKEAINTKSNITNGVQLY